jgi:hypothetical protein
MVYQAFWQWGLNQFDPCAIGRPSKTTFTTINDEENWNCNIGELTLLDDATAVFVYLLPKGSIKLLIILIKLLIPFVVRSFFVRHSFVRRSFIRHTSFVHSSFVRH